MSDQLLSTDPAAGLSAPAPRMNFAIVNGQRVPVEDDTPAAPRLLSADPQAGIAATPAASSEGDGFFEHYWNQVNPVPLGQLLPFPKSLGGAGLTSDDGQQIQFRGIRDAAHNILKAQGDVFDRAREAYDKGDHIGAAIHAMHWLIPILGPILDKAGTEMQAGQYRAGAGDTLGLATTIFGPEALARATARPVPGMGTQTPPVAPRPGTLTAEELASNTLADERGIPLNASIRTGSRTALAAEKRVANSMGGEATATETLAAQREGLKRTGATIADEVRPGAVSPEEGGGGVHQSIKDTVESLRSSANQQYGRVREIEADPQHAETVQTAKLGSAGYRRILDKLSQGWKDETGGKVIARPTHPELYTMRQIESELDAQQYQKGKLVNDSYDRTESHYARGASNADVYHEIQQEAGTASMTGKEMQAGIKETLETGDWNAASKAAYRVAQKRVQGAAGGVGRGPRLADDAPILGRSESVALPVDVSPVQDAVAPIHARLAEEGKLAPLTGDKAEAFRALDRLVNGPAHVSLTAAEDARGTLLKMARSDDPLFRSVGQGAASKAAAALDEAIQAKAGTVPELQRSLEGGRAATRAKHEIGDVWEQLPAEPVQAFDKLTAPRDRNVDLLRKVQQISPEKMADVARAKLQQWLDLATERGRFQHADKIYAEWEKLGPETKKILFEDPKQVQELDRFFLLAKRLAENPNPSGTAHSLTVFNVASQPVMYGIAKLLYTPSGVKALTEFLQAGSHPGTAAAMGGRVVGRTGARATALSRLAAVAKAEGVDLGLAADRDDSQ